MTGAIVAEGLSRRFGHRTAVDGVTFQVEQGEVFGMLGPNGAGKTTLVRLLNGVLDASSGTAHVLGLDPFTQGAALRQRVGVLTETPSLYERLTARANLRFFGTLYGVPDGELDGRVESLLGQFDLTERANDRVGTFSKGMKQRLALARTLIHRPPILYFDEPTAGLDPEASRQVTDLIEELSHKDGRTVFLCTHNLDEAGRLCDRVAVIHQGHLLAVGTAGQLARDLWEGQWLDFTLQTVPGPDLEAAVRGLPGVIRTALEGTQLAVQVNSETVIPGIVAGVVQAGGQIMRASPREHSLQEIYFRLQQEAQP